MQNCSLKVLILVQEVEESAATKFRHKVVLMEYTDLPYRQ